MLPQKWPRTTRQRRAAGASRFSVAQRCRLGLVVALGALLTAGNLARAAQDVTPMVAPTVDDLTVPQIEREAAEIVRVYAGLRRAVNAQAADECCREMITQVVFPIWQQRDRLNATEVSQQFVALYESLTYEFLVRASRNPTLKELYPHFERDIVAALVPLPSGYQR